MVADSSGLEPRTIQQNSYVWFLPLFVGSGCSALIYEIVWFQSLQLLVGASAISLGMLLATFMGGMCVGSLLFPRFVPRRNHPLRAYAILELAIGGLAVLLLYCLPSVERLYLASLGSGASSVFLRAFVAGLCLLPPTVLMGATLPAISRWFEADREGFSRIGFFYSANIVGAVIGCLSASFFLLRLFDVIVATWVAVMINVVVGLVAWTASLRMPYTFRPTIDRETEKSFRPSVAHAAIGLSGLAALGAEVIWTRELSLLLGTSVYTFSLILAVFLVALGFGSGLGAVWARKTNSVNGSLAWAQCGAAAGVGWATWIIARSLPFWPIDPSLSSSPWFSFQLDIVRVLWCVFPAAFFWGMSFPLALAAASNKQDPAKVVAGVYAANTLGAIIGALMCGWFAIPVLGMKLTEQMLLACPLLAAAALLVANRRETGRLQFGDGALLAALGLGVGCMLVLPIPPAGLIAYGRYVATWADSAPKYIYTGDGRIASIAVSEFDDGVRNFHVSGKVVASSEPQDMRLQRMLGHLPALLCKQPESVLIVGCGAGVTAGSFVAHPSIQRIVICEIEPLIPAAAGKYFRDYNHNIMEDPRLEIVVDDARHFMLTTKEKFDIITSDPIHPWVKGAATLYSQDYFELCKAHLKPGGIATQWVPLYESSFEAVQSEIATFFSAFPKGTIWNNDHVGEGYDLVLLGQEAAIQIDIGSIQTQLDQADHQDVVKSLREVRLGNSLAIMKTYAGRRQDLVKWLAGVTLNTDRNLRLQYLAGWSLNDDSAAEIRDSIKKVVSFPNDLIFGPPKELAALKLEFAKTSDKAIGD